MLRRRCNLDRGQAGFRRSWFRRLPGKRKHLTAVGCNGACWVYVRLRLIDVHQRPPPLNRIRATQCAYWRQRPFSFDVWIRTADPHLVYRVEDSSRINPSRDVVIGDHVWLGQSAMLLKGTVIGSGSIIGGAAVVAGKTIPSNTSWAGSPARQIARGVFFDGACVHGWTAEQTAASQTFASDKWIYDNAPQCDQSGLVQLANRLAGVTSAEERIAFVQSTYLEKGKNRFAIAEAPPSSSSENRGLPLRPLEFLRLRFRRR